MQATWFSVLALMLTTYAVLDGFDFGAGIVHLVVAKNDAERRTVLAAIGPLWDGNEVWLVAAGGVFVFAFPRAYAAAFSGLYLPLIVVLWLLVLRGIAVEVRSTLEHPLWSAAWDAVFAFASSTMAVVLGVALGNVVRGVPIDASGYFHADLFAARGAAHTGALDPFTAVFGVFAWAVLAAHGATFLAWKASGSVSARSRRAASWLWALALVLAVAVTLATAMAEPAYFRRVASRPWVGALGVSALASGAFAMRAVRLGRELGAFLASCGFIALALLATAGALYPTLLRSTVDDAFTLDAYAAASPHAGLATGLAILMPGLALAAWYVAYQFRLFRGKTHGGGYH